MVNWHEGDVLTNGIRLHCYRSGGDKPPLVLAHGITDSGQCWPMLSAELAPDYDLVAVDARGHGKSEKPLDGYEREAHAADLAAPRGLPIEALGLNRPAALGHSMGAGAATVLAARHAHAVGCVLLEDPPWRDLGSTTAADPAAATEWAERIRKRQLMSIDELLEEGRKDNPKWSEEIFVPWAAAKLMVSPNVVKYITTGDATWSDYIKGIKCPALLITAEPELGSIVTAETAERARELNPRIQAAHVAGAGHNIRREQFSAYTKAVRAFLAEVYPEA